MANTTNNEERKMTKAEKKQFGLRVFTGIMCAVMILGTVAAAIIAIVQNMG